MSYILASKSPRRIELLKNIINEFKVIPADIEEICPDDISLLKKPEYLAKIKAEHIAKSYPNDIVIGSDTGVFIDDVMLGKPKDKEDAFKMLSTLSGRTHKVITGCAICVNGKCHTFSEETEVTFTTLTNEAIQRYIETDTCMDKAGSYGIQGKGSILVEKINGDFYNVMGLPLCRLNKELALLMK